MGIRRTAWIHRTAYYGTCRVSRATFDESRQQLDEPQVIQREVEPKEHFQVIDHHRARHKALVEQEPQDILSKQVRGAYAERWVGLTALASVRSILFDLIHQAEHSLRLDVYLRRIVHLVCCLVDACKEEVLEML